MNQADYNKCVIYAKKILKGKRLNLLPGDLVADAFILIGKEHPTFKELFGKIKSECLKELRRSSNYQKIELLQNLHICNKCREEKPTSGFYIRKSQFNENYIISTKCKKCEIELAKEHQKDYYLKNREKILLHKKEWYSKNRNKTCNKPRKYNRYKSSKQIEYKKPGENKGFCSKCNIKIIDGDFYKSSPTVCKKCHYNYYGYGNPEKRNHLKELASKRPSRKKYLDEYVIKNRERLLVQKKKYYREHKDILLNKANEWKLKNREKSKQIKLNHAKKSIANLSDSYVRANLKRTGWGADNINSAILNISKLIIKHKRKIYAKSKTKNLFR